MTISGRLEADDDSSIFNRFEMVGDLEIDECTKLYANGCLPRVYYLVYQSAGLLGAGAMTIAFIQVCSFLL